MNIYTYHQYICIYILSNEYCAATGKTTYVRWHCADGDDGFASFVRTSSWTPVPVCNESENFKKRRGKKQIPHSQQNVLAKSRLRVTYCARVFLPMRTTDYIYVMLNDAWLVSARWIFYLVANQHMYACMFVRNAILSCLWSGYILNVVTSDLFVTKTRALTLANLFFYFYTLER